MSVSKKIKYEIYAELFLIFLIPSSYYNMVLLINFNK